MSAVTGGQSATVEIDYPVRLSRLLPFVKWLLLIPHYIVLYVVQIAALFASVIAWFAIVFTGRYPKGLFDFIVGVERWRLRCGAYLMLQTDSYPPFSLADDPSYPARLEVAYPERVARWRPFFAWLLAIPAEIVILVLALLAYVATFFAWLAILFTGRYPQGIFDFVTTMFRLTTKTALYSLWAIPEYPLGG